MKIHFLCTVGALLWQSVVHAQQPPAPPLPTWQDEIAKGHVPYHQLTVDDFPINDGVRPEMAFYIKPAVSPNYTGLVMARNGFVFAYIDRWMVFSGLDKNESSRRSAFKGMKAALPYAQAILDLSEIFARQLAALKPGELPSGRGNTREEAEADLTNKMEVFLAAKSKEIAAEGDAFAKATNQGQDAKKVRERAAEIRKRLDALPATTVPFNGPAAPSASPIPSGSPGATANATPKPAAP